jgi:malonyl-CoA O-methyltransferase
MIVPPLSPVEAYALWAPEYPAHAHNPLMKAEERAVLAMLPASLHGQTILDAGCGSGRYLLHALRRGAKSAIGIDLSPEMLHRAQQEIAPESAVHLARASVNALPLASCSVDVSVCALTLGHMPDLTQPLSELKRVTRPGGLILCTDMHPVGAERGWERTFRAKGRKYAVQHITHTLEDWFRVCTIVGLRVAGIAQPSIHACDVPPDAHFDAAALNIPVVVVLLLRAGER